MSLNDCTGLSCAMASIFSLNPSRVSSGLFNITGLRSEDLGPLVIIFILVGIGIVIIWYVIMAWIVQALLNWFLPKIWKDAPRISLWVALGIVLVLSFIRR